MMGFFALARAANGANDPNRTTSAAKFGTAGVNLKNAAGRLYVLDVVNTTTTAYYVLFFDKATAPVNGDTPIWRRQLPVSPSGEVPIDFGVFGLAFALGIGFALSTTPDTLTLPGTSDAHYGALWK